MRQSLIGLFLACLILSGQVSLAKGSHTSVIGPADRVIPQSEIKEAVDSYMSLLGGFGKDKELEIQHKEYEIYRNLGRAAVPSLVKILEDDNVRVQLKWHVALLLGNIGDSSAIPALMKALQHENSWLRGIASSALAWIGKDSEKPLLDSFEKLPGHLKKEAIAALGSLRSEKARPLIEKIAADTETKYRNTSIKHYIRANAIRALGKIGSTKSKATLQKIIDDSPDDSRLAELAKHSMRMIDGFARGLKPYEVRDPQKFQPTWHSSSDGSYNPATREWEKPTAQKAEWMFPGDMLKRLATKE